MILRIFSSINDSMILQLFPSVSPLEGPLEHPVMLCYLAFLCMRTEVLRSTERREHVTESQNGRGWKGPLWVI